MADVIPGDAEEALEALVDALVALVVAQPELPSPLGDYFDQEPESLSERETVVFRGRRAMDRLVRAGATTEDLYDVARLLRANAIFEALHVVDEGVDESLDPPWSVRVGDEKLIQLHGEFWYVVDQLGRK